MGELPHCCQIGLEVRIPHLTSVPAIVGEFPSCCVGGEAGPSPLLGLSPIASRQGDWSTLYTAEGRSLGFPRGLAGKDGATDFSEGFGRSTPIIV